MTTYSFKALQNELKRKFPGGELPEKVLAALRLAYDAHKGQYRESRNPGVRIPYIVHPVGVAKLAIDNLHLAGELGIELDDLVAACLTHDLVEDTAISIESLSELLSDRVASLVSALTKPISDASDDREKRNDLFIEQIAASELAARYIRLNDSLHNLSRPASTPLPLFEKILQKAQVQHERLLQRGGLDQRFVEHYVSEVDKASARLEQEKKFTSQPSRSMSVGDAVIRVLERSSGKILEYHDVLDLVQDICAPGRVGLWRSRERELIPLVTQGGSPHITVEALPDVPYRALKGSELRGFSGLLNDDDELLYVVQERIATESLDNIAITASFRRGEVPSWLSLEFLAMTAGFLTKNLLIKSEQLRSSIAKEIARLGLILEPGDVQAANMTRLDLQSLKRLTVEAAALEGIILLTIHDALFGERGHPSQPVEGLYVSGRTKSAASIVRKIIRRRFNSLAEVDDILGFRIVGADAARIASAVEQIVAALENQRTAFGRVERLRLNDYREAPTIDGYRGVHVQFDIRVRSADKFTVVPCEIQLRTAYQHAWSMVSESGGYKVVGTSDEHARRLKQLADETSRMESAYPPRHT